MDPSLYELMRYRRTVREFSSTPVEEEKLERILQAALYAPSGSNKSPFLIAVIRDSELKRRIRERAEVVEQQFYAEKRREGEVDFLNFTREKKLKVKKPFLTEAPILLSVSEDTRWSDRHSKESTWIAIAYMVLAVANEGLATVTYTPEPHDFMKDILELEEQYSPQVILPIGYPVDDTRREPRRPEIRERVKYL